MARRIISLVIAALLSWLGAHSASAQSAAQPTERQNNASQSGQQAGTAQVSPDTAEIAITATVTAKELLFRVVPNPKVEFSGKPVGDTVWDATRDNLPRPVQPGVTYRNIGIELKIVSRLPDIERIVAEALGESPNRVPTTDQIPPQDNHPSRKSSQAPSQNSQPSGGRPQ